LRTGWVHSDDRSVMDSARVRVARASARRRRGNRRWPAAEVRVATVLVQPSQGGAFRTSGSGCPPTAHAGPESRPRSPPGPRCRRGRPRSGLAHTRSGRSRGPTRAGLREQHFVVASVEPGGLMVASGRWGVVEGEIRQAPLERDHVDDKRARHGEAPSPPWRRWPPSDTPCEVPPRSARPVTARPQPACRRRSPARARTRARRSRAGHSPRPRAGRSRKPSRASRARMEGGSGASEGATHGAGTG
jgi:hypothetical protein